MTIAPAKKVFMNHIVMSPVAGAKDAAALGVA